MKNIYPNLRLGKLTILKETKRTKSGDRQYLVRCDCGTETIMSKSNLSREVKTQKSCGCIKRKHGLWKTRSYETWLGMMKRCYNESARNYPRYGGRGIRVCEQWHDFERFYRDMGERPKGMSLERTDNQGDYFPENCVWATPAEQSKNRRSTIFVTYNGITQCVSDWAKQLGIPRTRVYARIRKLGQTPKKALGFE